MRPLNAPGKTGVRGSTAYGTGVQVMFVPANTVAPALDDVLPAIDDVVTSNSGTWTGTPTPTFTYQWYRGAAAIAGQTAAAHTAVVADAGSTLKCLVTATNGVGVNSAYSNISGVVGLPENTALPVISDTTPTVDDVLTVTTGTWLGYPTPTYTYQWQHGTTNIGGATNSSYTVEVAYVGETLRCVVTATNSAGAVAANTANTTAVAPNITYATWNPADKGSGVTLSNGNLTASCVYSNSGVRSTIGKTSGKWYWEITVGGDAGTAKLGVAPSGWALTNGPGELSGTTGFGYNSTSATFQDGVFVDTHSTYTAGDIISVAYDSDANTIRLFKNGVEQGTAHALNADTEFAAVGNGGPSGVPTYTANFGATAFAYSVPSGYNSGLYN